MDVLGLSVMIDDTTTIQELLEGFATCHIRQMSWDEAWGELVKIAIYKTGPDVSEVAASMAGNLAAMNALQPFTKREVATMGGPSVFLPHAWKTALPSDDKRVWSIPWFAGVRVIYYWRDMLQKAGLDEQSAFQTPEQVEVTLDRLRASGIETPWAVTTHAAFVTLQNAASWIWGAGGDIVSADGKRILLIHPEALAALCAYYGLHRYMPRDLRKLEDRQTRSLFGERRVAAIVGSSGWLLEMVRQGIPVENVGVLPPPGPAYVGGGSNLVIWEYTRRKQDAVGLVRFLTSKAAQAGYCRRVGALPVRLDALDEPPFSSDPHYQVMVEALKAGRTFPSFARWGLIEERLDSAFMQIWDGLLANPDQDLKAAIAQRLEPLVQRLEITLTEPH